MKTIKLKELQAGDVVVIKKTAEREVYKRGGYFGKEMANYLGETVEIERIRYYYTYDFCISAIPCYYTLFYWPFEAIKLTGGVIRNGEKYKLIK